MSRVFNLACSAMILVLLIAAVAPLGAATLNVKGDVDVEGDGNGSPGNLTVNGSLTTSKYFKSYSGSITSGPTTKTVTMGSWDLCSLSMVYIAGEDNGGSDWGKCQVTGPSGDVTGPQPWTLTISSGSDDMNGVQCAAICFSFGSEQTGD